MTLCHLTKYGMERKKSNNFLRKFFAKQAFYDFNTCDISNYKKEETDIWSGEK
ncbi:MAG: hypothetical protein K0Q51_1440 [Rickettsiaceae bacterium]|jgi:hypothetical protein|nr:hypothetical protein [Rickettsiaceae bacterium]